MNIYANNKSKLVSKTDSIFEMFLFAISLTIVVAPFIGGVV